jgi:chromosome segregation ATPase
MEKDRDELEEQISRCEAEITSLELELGQFKSAEESIRVAALIDERRAHLKEITERWEQLVLILESECPPDESQIPSKMD